MLRPIDTARAARRLFGPLLLLLTAACSATTQLEGTDDAAVFGGARLALALDRDTGLPSERFADLQFDVAEGEFDQVLGAGQDLTFDGTVFSGPGTVAADLDWTSISARYRQRFELNESVFVDGSVGVGFLELESEVSGLGSFARRSDNAFGPMCGVTVGVELVPRLLFIAGYELGGGFEVDEDVDYSALEIGLQAQIADPLAVFVGWRRLEIEVDRDPLPGSLDESGIEADLSGVRLGLRWLF